MLGVDNMRIGIDMREYGGFGGHIGGMAAYPASFAGGASGGGGMYGAAAGAAPSFGHMATFPSQAMSAPHCGGYEDHGSASYGGFESGAPHDVEDSRDSDNPPITPPPARERFSYTRYQLELLNGIFVTIRYPNSIQKQLIAKRVGITRDQVKIWFQNRRRKDVVASQGKGKSPPVEKPPSGMVPDRIMSGIVTELSKYEGDPKGKKLKEKLAGSGSNNGGGHRPKPYDRPASAAARRPSSSGSISPPSFDSAISPPAMTSSYPAMTSHDYPALKSYQNSGISVRTSPDYPQQQYTAISPVSASEQRLSGEFQSAYKLEQQYETESVSSEGSDRKVVGYIPSNEQLDMVAPPNAVAPPSSSLPELNPDQLTSLESPRQEEVSRENSPSGEQPVGSPPMLTIASVTSEAESPPAHRLPIHAAPYVSEAADVKATSHLDYSTPYPTGGEQAHYMNYPQHCLPGYPPNQTAPGNFYDFHFAHQSRQFQQEDVKTEFPGVFPVSLHANSAAMMRPSMPGHYNSDFYQLNDAYRQPSSGYRDHYQSLLISPFQNQYFASHPERGTAVADAKSYAQL